MRMKTLFAILLTVILAMTSRYVMAQTIPQTQCVTNAIAGGTGDALTVPLLPCGLATNILILTLSGTNVTSSPTLQMVGFPALPIVNASGAPVSAGSLPGAGAVVLLSGTGSRWLLLGNGVASSGTGLATVQSYVGGSTVNLSAGAQIVVIANLSAQNTTVVLPPAADFPNCPTVALSCPVISVKNGTGASDDGVITVTTADSIDIDNAASYPMPFSRQANEFFLEGTQWGVK